MEVLYLLAERKRQAWLLRCLSEILVLDAEISDLQGILGHEALHRARTILDRELGSVHLVSRRGAGIVLGVEEACNRAALGAWDPEVTRPWHMSATNITVTKIRM